MLDYNHGAERGEVSNAQTSDVDALRRDLLARLDTLLPQLFPEGRSDRGKFLVGDVSGAPGRSLDVVLDGDKAGLWIDRATDEGGDIFALIAAARGLDVQRDFGRVLEEARTLLGTQGVEPSPARIDPNPTPVDEGADLAPDLGLLDDLGPATAKYDYLDADGKLIAVVYRYDPPGRRKEFRPWDVQRRRASPPRPRPLYNQPGIARADTVVLVEGEKCAQALIDLGIVATTAMNGAQAPTRKTDWAPLAGKLVLVWPDRDKPGWDYAVAAGTAALVAGASRAAILIPPRGPIDNPSDGWDAADAVREGFDVADFIAVGPRTFLSPPHRALSSDEAIRLDPDTENARAGSDAAGDAGGTPVLDCSDDDVAERFAKLYAADWQFVGQWNKWLNWDGQRWRLDMTLQAVHLVRLVCRKAALEAAGNGSVPRRGALKMASYTTIQSVERLARTDRPHAARAEAWDVDPWLLNTPAGTIELRSAMLRPHCRTDRITRITHASPVRGAHPVWTQFLQDVTGHDDELIQYLQRMVGYSLTGETSAHAIFFLFGTGANGKSVFVNTIMSLLGDYAKHAPMDTFMETRTERHPTDMAGLRGARLVASIETEQGRRWAEAKIKALTGGDPIVARFMRQDFFEYVPQFKLVIAGNHKPTIRNVDEAMKRRLHLIPFTVTIPPAQRDPQLGDKLLAERDAILAWALDGCLAWQREGLAPPKKVMSATDEYFDEEDAVGEFVREECVVVPTARESIARLYRRWRDRTEQRGEFSGTIRWLVQQLLGRGFLRARMSGGQRAIGGLQLRADARSGRLPEINEPGSTQ